ncbi:MAG: hypothetical protein OXE42_17380 [Gammaproteobacteria bacterium]|nr:hypothetical protein [Gammaproteobacteria bacterium]
MLDNLDQIQIPSDVLADLGLVHKYPLHIDVINNETGFALYVETPIVSHINDGMWDPLFGSDAEYHAKNVHIDDYVPGMAPEYEFDSWNEGAYLRIREVDDDGNTGEWHTVQLQKRNFTKNTNPPDALEDFGFNRFDSVTWLEGLDPGKNYQVQMWLDSPSDNGRLDLQGYWKRSINYVYDEHDNYVYDEHGNELTEPGDWYYWQEPDVYSDIHDINTDSAVFDVDIDGDGTMDFFADVEVVDAGNVMDSFIA